jgi:hypothetical protein
MALQQVYGQFKQIAIGGSFTDTVVLFDLVGNETGGSPHWSPGTMCSTELTVQPSLPEQWSVLGWTISYLAFCQAPDKINLLTQTMAPFAANAELWAGLTAGKTVAPADSPQKTIGATLPSDLSTFTKLWSLNDDTPFPQADLTDGATVRSLPQSPRGVTYMLPEPLKIVSGEGLAMNLILTPMLGYSVFLAVKSAGYTILYDSGPA